LKILISGLLIIGATSFAFADYVYISTNPRDMYVYITNNPRIADCYVYISNNPRDKYVYVTDNPRAAKKYIYITSNPRLAASNCLDD
jgi:hypothetical protein